MWYVNWNMGISLAADYPYEAITQRCWADWWGPVNVDMVHRAHSYDQASLMAAIAQQPVSVCVDSESPLWMQYTGGVISDAKGCGSKLTHAVVAGGYGTDAETGLDYYLVRNSWGADWGEDGYVKLARQGDGYGVCGVQEMHYWPDVSAGKTPTM